VFRVGHYSVHIEYDCFYHVFYTIFFNINLGGFLPSLVPYLVGPTPQYRFWENNSSLTEHGAARPQVAGVAMDDKMGGPKRQRDGSSINNRYHEKKSL
jgi:hypothetical protein